jgi:hypothetical protein
VYARNENCTTSAMCHVFTSVCRRLANDAARAAAMSCAPVYEHCTTAVCVMFTSAGQNLCHIGYVMCYRRSSSSRALSCSLNWLGASWTCVHAIFLCGPMLIMQQLDAASNSIISIIATELIADQRVWQPTLEPSSRRKRTRIASAEME